MFEKIVTLKKKEDILKIYNSDNSLIANSDIQHLINHINNKLEELPSEENVKVLVHSYIPTFNDVKIKVSVLGGIYVVIPTDFIEWEEYGGGKISKIDIDLPMNMVLKDIKISNSTALTSDIRVSLLLETV